MSDSIRIKAMARVSKRVRDNEGNARGTESNNSLTNKLLYEVEFPDGHMEELQYNVIAENMMSQVDSEGHYYQILSEISDHESNHLAITKRNLFIHSKNGHLNPKITTRGWKIEVEWKDGSVNWVSLEDLKASNPVEVADYAITNNIDEEPAFKW